METAEHTHKAAREVTVRYERRSGRILQEEFCACGARRKVWSSSGDVLLEDEWQVSVNPAETSRRDRLGNLTDWEITNAIRVLRCFAADRAANDPQRGMALQIESLLSVELGIRAAKEDEEP